MFCSFSNLLGITKGSRGRSSWLWLFDFDCCLSLHDTSWTVSSWTDRSWTTEIGRVQPVLEEPGTDDAGTDCPGSVVISLSHNISLQRIVVELPLAIPCIFEVTSLARHIVGTVNAFIATCNIYRHKQVSKRTVVYNELYTYIQRSILTAINSEMFDIVYNLHFCSIIYLLLNRARSTNKTSRRARCNAVHQQTNRTNK